MRSSRSTLWSSGCCVAAMALCGLSACAPALDSEAIRRAREDQAASAVALVQADRPLESSQLLSDPPAMLESTDSGFVTSGAGLMADGSGSPVTQAAVAAVGNPRKASGEGARMRSASPLSYNATVEFSSQLSVSSSGLSLAGYRCTVLAPFNHLSCNVAGMTVRSADLLPTAQLQLLVLSQDGKTEAGLTNALNVRKTVIRQVADTSASDTSDDYISGLVGDSGKLYFVAARPDSNLKLMSYDDNTRTLKQISNIDPGGSDWPEAVGVFDGKIFFGAFDSSSQFRLYSYDDSTSTVSKVSRTSAGSDDVMFYGSAELSGQLYFDSVVGNARKLVGWDPSADKITQVSDTSADANVADNPREFTVAEGKLFLVADLPPVSGDEVSKLFVYDPMTQEMRRISDTNPGDTHDDDPSDLTVYDGHLYFSANRADGIRKLFGYDLSTGELRQLTNTTGTRLRTDDPTDFVVVNNHLFFKALNPTWVSKIFRYDPLSGAVTQISNTRQDNTIADAPDNMLLYNKKLFFTANNSLGVQKLYSFDDKSGALLIAADTRDNEKASNNIFYPTVYGDRLYFSAAAKDDCSDAIYGGCSTVNKLFVYDDVERVLLQVSDTRGSQISGDNPADLYVFNKKLFFTSRNPQRSRKLYSLCDLSQGCTP